MDKRQGIMEVGALWGMSGFFALPFVYCLNGARRGEIEIGRIARSPDVEGYLHGSRAWLLAACTFAFFASMLLITIVATWMLVSLRLNENSKPTKTQGGLIVCSLVVIALSSLVAATDMYIIGG